MIKRNHLLALLLFGVISVYSVSESRAQSTLSAHSQLWMKNYQSRAKLKNVAHSNVESVDAVSAFIMVDNDADVETLKAKGVTIGSRTGKLLTVRLPAEQVADVARLSGVKHLSIARHVELCNKTALQLSHFPVTEPLTSSATLLNAGRGVVVGVIDVGVDFNHINFLDDDGKSRIVRVYLPGDDSGVPPTINGETLPGSEYTTPQMIAALTTDTPAESHGTHTTGTAAGSYMANGYHGVAPGAQIVVCAMPDEELTDVNIVNSLNYIFDYADSMGLPAVVNMSLGSQDGAHDGSSPLCLAMDRLSGQGRICVVSAGNDADMPMHIKKTLAERDSLGFFLADWIGSRDYMLGYSSMWSSSDRPHSIELVLWDTQTNTPVRRMPLPEVLENDSVYTITIADDEVLSQYMFGEIEVVATLESNGRYHSLIETNCYTIDKKRYRLGVIHKAPDGETLEGWAGNNVVYSSAGSLSGWTSGQREGCISDLATGDESISVGAYCSVKSFAMMSGDTVSYSRCTPIDIAYFSGYGPDARGIERPEVVAPGYALVSSVSRYREKYKDPASVFTQVVKDGEVYPYGLYYGTSMSTPVVTGAIALWLEMNPDLSPQDLKQLLIDSSYRDSYVTGGDPHKWGAGKLDIAQGIKCVLKMLDGDVNNDKSVNAADITAIYNILLQNSDNHRCRADVNADGAITAADVTHAYNRLMP